MSHTNSAHTGAHTKLDSGHYVKASPVALSGTSSHITYLSLKQTVLLKATIIDHIENQEKTIHMFLFSQKCIAE